MYGFDESTGTGTVKRIPAGIQENIKLTKVAYENSRQDGAGAMVLRFHFEDADNALFNHTEFPIDEERTRKNAANFSGVTPDELVKREYQSMNERLKHICSCFVPNDKAQINGVVSWEDFCNKYIDLLGQSYANTELRLKIVLNKNDYTCFPRRAISPFIEVMNGSATKLSITKFDRIEAIAKTSEDEFGSTQTAANTEDAF